MKNIEREYNVQHPQCHFIILFSNSALCRLFRHEWRATLLEYLSLIDCKSSKNKLTDTVGRWNCMSYEKPTALLSLAMRLPMWIKKAKGEFRRLSLRSVKIRWGLKWWKAMTVLVGLLSLWSDENWSSTMSIKGEWSGFLAQRNLCGKDVCLKMLHGSHRCLVLHFHVIYYVVWEGIQHRSD